MKEKIEANWQKILDILIKEQDVTQVAVHTWIEPLTIQSVTDSTITFFVSRGPRGIEFIKHKYYDVLLSMAIEQVTGRQFEIIFTDSPAVEEQTVPEEKPAKKKKTSVQVGS